MNYGTDLSKVLPNLRVQREKPDGFWRVSLPKLPWKYEKAEEDRNSLIVRLGEAYPVLALWVSDCCSDEAVGWKHIKTTDAEATLKRLYEGGWALFFFAHSLDRLPSQLELVPREAEAVNRLLHELSASAVVVSWYDDRDWLVGLRTPL